MPEKEGGIIYNRNYAQRQYCIYEMCHISSVCTMSIRQTKSNSYSTTTSTVYTTNAKNAESKKVHLFMTDLVRNNAKSTLLPQQTDYRVLDW